MHNVVLALVSDVPGHRHLDHVPLVVHVDQVWKAQGRLEVGELGVVVLRVRGGTYVPGM